MQLHLVNYLQSNYGWNIYNLPHALRIRYMQLNACKITIHTVHSYNQLSYFTWKSEHLCMLSSFAELSDLNCTALILIEAEWRIICQ